MVVKSITDMGDRLLVLFESGREMFVSKNKNNALRQKLEVEYLDLYPVNSNTSSE